MLVVPLAAADGATLAAALHERRSSLLFDLLRPLASAASTAHRESSSTALSAAESRYSIAPWLAKT